MKKRRIVFLSLCAALVLSSGPAVAAEETPPADCSAYPVHPKRGTCENARKFGLSFDTAREIEGLAEQEHAFGFCGIPPDEAFRARARERLARDGRLRALHDEHLTMLKHRCVYDPEAWCRGFRPGPLEGGWSAEMPRGGRLTFRFTGKHYVARTSDGQIDEAGEFAYSPDGGLAYRVTNGQAAGQSGVNRVAVNGDTLVLIWANGASLVFRREGR